MTITDVLRQHDHATLRAVLALHIRRRGGIHIYASDAHQRGKDSK